MKKIAFVFPGQGSQAIGMLNGFAGNAVVAETIAEASQALGINCRRSERRTRSDDEYTASDVSFSSRVLSRVDGSWWQIG